MPNTFTDQTGRETTLVDPALFIALATLTMQLIRRDLVDMIQDNPDTRLPAVENTLHAVNVELSRR